MDNTELLITNVYIPPASSCNGRYSPPLDHLLIGIDSLVLADFNVHHLLWHSGTTDTRGNQLADSISISSFAVINTDSPTRLPGNANPSSPDVSLASASLITSSEWQTHTTMSTDHQPILIGLQTTATSSPVRHRTYINLKKADRTRYRQEIERKLSSRHLPTNCQKDDKLFRATLLKAVFHHIPTGRRKLYTQQVPAEILAMMEERDDQRKQDPACCCCLPTPMTLASGGSPMFPIVVYQPASPSIWPAVQSLRRGRSTNPGVTMWYVCGCS